MKAVKIETIIQPIPDSDFINKRKYSVFLGNNYRTIFSSKRDALKFIADTNKYLSVKMHQVNNLYGQTISVYRLCWPYFFHNKKGGRNRGFDERKCEENIKIVTDQLNRLIASPTPNHNAFVWSYFNRAIDCLAEIMDICMELHRSRSNGAEVVICQLILTQLLTVKNELLQYPSNIQTDIEIKVYRSVLKIA